MNNINLELNASLTLGEGPCYDNKNNTLYFVDILEKELHSLNILNKKHEIFKFKEKISSVGLRQNGELIITLEDGIYFFSIEKNVLSLLDKYERNIITNRFNDGKCDPLGRYWAGTMNENELENKGSLYVLDDKLKLKKEISRVSISNGLAWDVEREKMYYIDTPTKKIAVYNFNMRTGEISDLLEVIKIPDKYGLPDGMTIDEEGMLWIAMWGGNGIVKCNPFTKKIVDYIYIPAKNVTACTFGGESLDTLYITTARDGLSEELIKKYPLSGGLFSFKPGVKGIPSYRFTN